jgi:hypothetical protein
LIEAQIEALPDAAGKHGYELDYLIFSGTGSKVRRGRVDLTGFTLFDGMNLKVGDTVLFGGRLQTVTLGEDRLWRVALAPSSGVRFSSQPVFKALETSFDWPATGATSEEAQ